MCGFAGGPSGQRFGERASGGGRHPRQRGSDPSARPGRGRVTGHRFRSGWVVRNRATEQIFGMSAKRQSMCTKKWISVASAFAEREVLAETGPYEQVLWGPWHLEFKPKCSVHGELFSGCAPRRLEQLRVNCFPRHKLLKQSGLDSAKWVARKLKKRIIEVMFRTGMGSISLESSPEGLTISAGFAVPPSDPATARGVIVRRV